MWLSRTIRGVVTRVYVSTDVYFGIVTYCTDPTSPTGLSMTKYRVNGNGGGSDDEDSQVRTGLLVFVMQDSTFYEQHHQSKIVDEEGYPVGTRGRSNGTRGSSRVGETQRENLGPTEENQRNDRG